MIDSRYLVIYERAKNPWTPYSKRKNEELAAIVTFKHGADAHSLLTSGLEHKIREKQILIKPIPKSLKIETAKGLLFTPYSFRSRSGKTSEKIFGHGQSLDIFGI